MVIAAEQVGAQEESGTGVPRRLRLISADAHVNEAPDLWSTRLPAAYRSRAPRIEHFEQGDAWILEGVADPINFGMNACAGLPPEEHRAWIRWASVRKGGWDPAERCKEMDRDGVDAELLYPTPRLCTGYTANPDRGFALACTRAYNDWLSDYCSYAPDRLAGVAVVPITGLSDALKEFERALQLPGIRTALLPAYPDGTLQLAPAHDPLWAAFQAAGTPVNIHVGLRNEMPTAHKSNLPGDVRFYDAPQRMLEFLWGGVFDRFPRLQLVFVEVDCGWVPFFKEQTDNRYWRIASDLRRSLTAAPSEYFDRHVSYTFVTDTYAVVNRDRVGVTNMLWSSDYPHLGADWPNSWLGIQSAFANVPRAERDLILWGNAARLYGF
jgi:predicted TIM-barrel fold metal-dependent hydrolase